MGIYRHLTCRRGCQKDFCQQGAMGDFTRGSQKIFPRGEKWWNFI